MVYDPAKPQPQDKLSVSQADLLENFGQLNTQFGVNHVPFDDTSGDKGKHKFVTFVEQSTDPESKGDEHLLYTKDDSGEPEIFARPESNGDAYQITKDGNLFVGLLPIVAVNFDKTAPFIQGSSLGVSSITQPGSAGRYKINFTAAVTTALSGSNDYFWSISGFDNSSNPVIAQVTNDSTYGNVVTDSFIQVDFKNQNNTLVSNLTRATVVCWRFQ